MYFNQFLFLLCSIFIVQQIHYSHQNYLVDIISDVASWLEPSDTNGDISDNATLVRFLLYSSRTHLDYNETLEFDDVNSIQKSSFNKSLPIKVITPGFLDGINTPAVNVIKDAYLKKNTQANIIQLDWSDLSTAEAYVPEIYYDAAAGNVPKVAKRLSEFLIFMIENGFLSGPDAVHLIGFSLGAHVSGLAGYYFQQSTSKLLGRITGLDPAYPDFQSLSLTGRLDKSDAKFVDVTHTNKGELGYDSDLGDADFYMNGGGPYQENCPVFSIYRGVCSHSDAYHYFTKSISENILACDCTNVTDKAEAASEITKLNCVNPQIYGENCSERARGDFCVKIKD